MKLDAIPANANITMTAELDRMFRYAKCQPACHACEKSIAVGQVFKLLSHTRLNDVTTDEMCCGKCGEAELVRRDKREHREYLKDLASESRGRGYSRPSRALCKT